MIHHRHPVVFLSLLLFGCATGAPTVVSDGEKLPVSSASVPVVTQQYSSFADWRQSFIQRAIARGINPQTVNAVMAGADYQQSIANLDGKQPEFSKHIWSYLDSAVSDSRIRQGQQNFNQQRNLLNNLAQRYGVPPEIVTAIWGLETSYGANTGNSDLASALSTLAYDGRRRDFAENQLIAMMQLVESGDIEPQQLRGSWAGGMGQTQFIPTTYAAHAVDGDGDGRRNLWTTADALASTASYLSESGWQLGLPWGIEVSLPIGFSDQYVGATLPWSSWQALGVQATSGGLPANAQATLWLPGGVHGPAFLTTKNFDVIKVYNNASSYALAVSLLGDAIVGRASLHTTWPRSAQPLSTAQVTALQQRLQALGFDPGKADGILGANTRSAFQAWQRSQGIFADGFVAEQTTQGLF
ncbi:lytic murein transglycosylase [Cardiobacteriaceae bacterium TAE3-ERU3]|nr:lytic murein transglycosylase [Cardiobacteriaceae bacterium TAE3-ERU3]